MISSARQIINEENERLKKVRGDPVKPPEIIRKELAGDLRRIAFIIEKDMISGLESAAWRLADTLGFIAELTEWQGTGIGSFTGLGYKLIKDIPANSQKSDSEKVNHPEEVCK